MGQQGILSGLEIKEAFKRGDIEVDPAIDESRLNPASYDLTLGRRVSVYRSCVQAGRAEDWECDGMREDGTWGIPGERLVPRFSPGERINPVAGVNCLDVAKENPVCSYDMDDRGILLLPGIGYLAHTEERIRTDRYVPVLDGKSSIGRLFCLCHFTAGYGDAGFDGQYTLEVGVLHPLIVYPGMRFCQIRFHTIVGEVDVYGRKGSYRGAFATGPVPSRAFQMFRR